MVKLFSKYYFLAMVDVFQIWKKQGKLWFRKKILNSTTVLSSNLLVLINDNSMMCLKHKCFLKIGFDFFWNLVLLLTKPIIRPRWVSIFQYWMVFFLFYWHRPKLCCIMNVNIISIRLKKVVTSNSFPLFYLPIIWTKLPDEERIFLIWAQIILHWLTEISECSCLLILR